MVIYKGCIHTKDILFQKKNNFNSENVSYSYYYDSIS